MFPVAPVTRIVMIFTVAVAHDRIGAMQAVLFDMDGTLVDSEKLWDISLAALAQLVELSLYHFAHVFKQSFGVAPHHYHMARRIDRATTLLQRSTLPVTQIGIQIGFRESSSFTRAYRKFTGVTPSAYRQHRRN